MESIADNRTIIFSNGFTQIVSGSNTALRDVYWNSSDKTPVYYDNTALREEFEECRKSIIDQYCNQIAGIIRQDEFIDGEISDSEEFMKSADVSGETEYVMEALMRLYADNLMNPLMLEGILVMISSLPFEKVAPKGQIMAMGLLSNKNLQVRDRAIQCFERWNSKKGLQYLKSLECYPAWLQQYVDKVIYYIERDGED